jgi:cyclophilin family peptidyl-prolyl cis-trans isomerase
MISVAHVRPMAPRAILLVGVALLFAACSASGGGASAAPSVEASAAAAACPTSQPAPLPAGETRTVTIETPKGSIAIKIEADLSPIAAGNFVALAACGYYDGVVFHRVVQGFVIQGGDPTGTGTGGPGYEIQDEPVTTTYHRGTVAMARSSQPNSVGSQFFIVLDDAAAQSLADPRANNYQIIGTVASGMDAVDAIAAAAGGVEIPSNPVAMTRVTVNNP